VSTTAPSAAAGVWTAAAAANVLAAVVVLLLFVLACVETAQRQPMTTGFDETAHASYVAHIQHTGDAWPALETMRLLDPQTFEFTSKPNYLNHPPLFYALLAALGPRLEGRRRGRFGKARFLQYAQAAC
jgi:hypothetical protein